MHDGRHLLMAENNHWTWTTEKRFASRRGAGLRVLNDLLGALHRENWSEPEVFGIRLAVEEAIVNAIKHGNGSDVKKHVQVACQLSPDRVRVEIIDEGPGFNPANVPDCTAEENLERPCGRGIMLMRSFMSQVQYHDRGNRVVLEKHRASQG